MDKNVEQKKKRSTASSKKLVVRQTGSQRRIIRDLCLRCLWWANPGEGRNFLAGELHEV